LVALALGNAQCNSESPRATQVAAASDLTQAFEELGRLFEQRTQREIEFTFGSSGLLAKQIHNGAPYDMFAAANVALVDELAASGDCDKTTRAPYARGRIAVWTRRDFGSPPATLADLGDPRYKRIAIANPEHAPYGKAARQALEKLGLWSVLEPRIVYGENVKQAQQFAQSGNAEAAIIALSLAIGGDDGAYVLVDDSLHAPIDQALIACTHGKNLKGGRDFASFVKSAEGRAVMQRYGFVLPEAAPAAPTAAP
jgi:molybdate transport system substrate-binding protein